MDILHHRRVREGCRTTSSTCGDSTTLPGWGKWVTFSFSNQITTMWTGGRQPRALSLFFPGYCSFISWSGSSTSPQSETRRSQDAEPGWGQHPDPFLLGQDLCPRSGPISSVKLLEGKDQTVLAYCAHLQRQNGNKTVARKKVLRLVFSRAYIKCNYLNTAQ